LITTLLLLAQAAATHSLLIEKGAELYRMHCAVPFCHGAAGTAGRAPALAGRNFEPKALRRAITHGIPNRGMPAFQRQLRNAGVDAVFAYVRSLRSPEPAKTNGTIVRPAKLSKEAVAGRELFFDSSRLPGCAACHAIDNMGGEVAAPLRSISSVEALRAVRATQVRTARVPGEAEFPAVIAQVTSESMRLYDLSSPLPVLRTFPKSEVTLREGSRWTHSSAVARYAENELEFILAYIRAVGATEVRGPSRSTRPVVP
jgi:mono/diheme cytochrome c family protein